MQEKVKEEDKPEEEVKEKEVTQEEKEKKEEELIKTAYDGKSALTAESSFKQFCMQSCGILGADLTSS